MADATSAPAAPSQVRVHYYWYKKLKKQCEDAGPCDMGGFTRLLHSGKSDDLMNEIPTYVTDPLPQETVDHSWCAGLSSSVHMHLNKHLRVLAIRCCAACHVHHVSRSALARPCV